MRDALADCNAWLDRKAPACRTCGDAISLNDARVHDSRGFTYFRLGQFDQAISDFNWALGMNPKDADALYLLGLVKRAQGDQSASTADIAAAKAVNPKIEEMHASYGVR